MTERQLPPVERSIAVSWNPATAFKRFTHEFETLAAEGNTFDRGRARGEGRVRGRGDKVERAHRGYGLGWQYVLNVWAGRQTWRMSLVDVASWLMRRIGRINTGLDAQIASAGGAIPPAPTQSSDHEGHAS